ncbi:hypothetical protein GCM10010174_80470 [Kutzneria viridogrisea]
MDPCAVLTEPQRQQLQLDPSPRAVPPAGSAQKTTRSCSYSQPGLEPAENYLVTLASGTSVQSYLHDSALTQTSTFTTAGKPGTLAHKTEQQVSCNALVEVSPQQILDIQFAGLTGHADTTDTACAKAQAGADLAVQTVLAKR